MEDPLSLQVYPISARVQYGATAQSIAFDFYVVNNVSVAQSLSGYTLTALNAPVPNPVASVVYSDNCGGTLPPRGKTGVCTMTATITTAGNPVGAVTYLAPIKYQFSFNYSGAQRMQTKTSPEFLLTFAQGKLVSSAQRTFSFYNNCTSPAQTVWLGVSSGAAPSINPVIPGDANSCSTDTDCYPGSKCINVEPSVNHCLWENPVPAGGATGYELAPGDRTTMTFPAYDNGIDQTWSGGIAARIGCTGAGANCTIADCGASSSDGACPLPSGFQTPTSTAEFTLQGKNPIITSNSGYPDGDTYDITVINGMTAGGISMAPTNAAPWNAAAPYTCGAPGNSTGLAPLGNCNWAASPPMAPLVGNQSDYVWIENPTGACPNVAVDNGGCTAPQVCGHTISGSTVSATVSCGTQLGLLTPDAVCAKDASFGAPFNCASTVTQDIAYSYREVYGCSKGEFKNSCYTPGAADTCCGCQNWDMAAIYPAVIPTTQGATPLTQSCGTTSNPNWQSIAEPKLSWLKQACPTAYVFPFDDASSTFKCQVLDDNNVNVANYEITYCP